jgi:hypothetical protein
MAADTPGWGNSSLASLASFNVFVWLHKASKLHLLPVCTNSWHWPTINVPVASSTKFYNPLTRGSDAFYSRPKANLSYVVPEAASSFMEAVVFEDSPLARYLEGKFHCPLYCRA